MTTNTQAKTQPDLEELLNRLMAAGNALSPLLADTDVNDTAGRSMRLIDLLVSQAVKLVRQGQRFGAEPSTLVEAAAKLACEAARLARESEDWLRARPEFVSRAIDGKRRPVSGTKIAVGTKALGALLLSAAGAESE